MITYIISEENYYICRNGKQRLIAQINYTWQRHPHFDNVATLLRYLHESSKTKFGLGYKPKKPNKYVAYIDIHDTLNADSYVNDNPLDVIVATLKPASNEITFQLLSTLK